MTTEKFFCSNYASMYYKMVKYLLSFWLYFRFFLITGLFELKIVCYWSINFSFNLFLLEHKSKI